jgi:short-subunit dehydrogenase
VVITADLSLRGEAQRLGTEALRALGEVDILINNAGVGIGGQQAVVADDDIARVLFETNYWSALALQRVLVPGMKKRKRGVIVNVTSIGSIVCLPLAGHYSSSKAALSLASEALRMELRDFNVHVLNVLPGPVETAMLNEMRVVPGGSELLEKMPRGDVDTLARKVVKAIERGRKELVYPGSLSIVRHLPTLAAAVNRRAVRVVDVTDERAVMGGSSGDQLVRAARTAFERKESVTPN